MARRTPEQVGMVLGLTVSQMTYEALQDAAHHVGLSIYGGFHPTPEDLTPDGTKTLLMLGPKEPGFWDHFIAQPEYQDGAPDPMDRWSTRVITQLSDHAKGTAIFPFGGPPFQPFIAWAIRTGRAWTSPVGILVHDEAGLFVSYRGALALPYHMTLPELPEQPCVSCEAKPCLTACPVDAMGDHAYDVPLCKDYLRNPDQSCLSLGCQVRRSCPVSQSYGRAAAQSGYHMKVFLG